MYGFNIGSRALLKYKVDVVGISSVHGDLSLQTKMFSMHHSSLAFVPVAKDIFVRHLLRFAAGDSKQLALPPRILDRSDSNGLGQEDI